MESETFSAQELADRMGIHRGTIRNYVWRGVLPPPIGKGRNARYGMPHLHILMAIAQERQGRMLIRDWKDYWKEVDAV